MEKETKKVYTVNVKPSIMEKAKLKAEENKRSLSSHIEYLLEKDLEGFKIDKIKGEDLLIVLDRYKRRGK